MTVRHKLSLCGKMNSDRAIDDCEEGAISFVACHFVAVLTGKRCHLKRIAHAGNV